MPGWKIFWFLESAGADEYDHVLEFLKRHHGRKLCEVMDAEIDISDVISVAR
jgi:hypothetical protein